MITFNLPEAVLLHLYMYRRMQGPYLPLEITQEGIALSLNASRSHVSITMTSLMDRGLVRSEVAHVRGKKRRVRIYELTEKGIGEAERMLPVLKEINITFDGRTSDSMSLFMKGVPIGEIISRSGSYGWRHTSLPRPETEGVARQPVQGAETPLTLQTETKEQISHQGAPSQPVPPVPDGCETPISEIPEIRVSSGGIQHDAKELDRTSPEFSSIVGWYAMSMFGCALIVVPLCLMTIFPSFATDLCMGWFLCMIVGVSMIASSLKGLQRIHRDASRHCAEIVLLVLIYLILLLYELMKRYRINEVFTTALATSTFVVLVLWVFLTRANNIGKEIRSKFALASGILFACLGVFSPHTQILSRYAEISLFMFLFAAGMVILSIEIHKFQIHTYLNALKVSILVLILLGLAYLSLSLSMTRGLTLIIALWASVVLLILIPQLVEWFNPNMKTHIQSSQDQTSLVKFLVASGMLTVASLFGLTGATLECVIVICIAFTFVYLYMRDLRINPKTVASYILVGAAELATILYIIKFW